MGREKASGPAGISGPVKPLKGPGLFDFKGSLWSLLSVLLDERGPVRASEAWLLCAGRPRPFTKVILSKRAGRPIGYGDFRIVKGGSVYNEWYQPFGKLSMIG